ncbi:Transposase, Ptta/En/Spm, plant [Cinnamomum micranthum f. kanehirae]|uniref:Transposase, Ptta/En/Spm, plant n=1 Tax=Cinnamomum micranthum f. kanehirae TaxID=337451 RepID=A0A443P6A9_9MAGN|nr:Transposase, Ptta/En/Spm, plant [Cinnamomum micranthum f. kanehirae]
MQTTTHERDASIFDSTIEPEAHSIASTSTRRGRGRSKNISLTKLIKDTGQKLRIEIPEGLSRPVGKYAKEFKTEVGIICRTYAPLACYTWPTVKQEHRQIFYDRILDKFDIDLHNPRLKKAINSYLASTFKNYRNRLHSHYKRVGNHREACQKPYEGVSQEDWELCCNRFCSEEFQKVSKKNFENRMLLKVNHCVGSKSFVEYLHETRDAPISRIELWHKTHYSQDKGWSTPECQMLYEKMITLQSQPTEDDSPPLTDDEICRQVLGTRPGYVRGLGHGVVAPPSSSTGLYNSQRVEELTKRATAAERQSQELAEQLQRMEAQMESQRQQMEAQMEVQMAGQKQQMEAQMDDMRSWQKNMEAMMQSIMAQKMGTPPW